MSQVRSLMTSPKSSSSQSSQGSGSVSRLHQPFRMGREEVGLTPSEYFRSDIPMGGSKKSNVYASLRISGADFKKAERVFSFQSKCMNGSTPNLTAAADAFFSGPQAISQASQM